MRASLKNKLHDVTLVHSVVFYDTGVAGAPWLEARRTF